MLNIKETLTVAMILFAVIDITGSIPIVIGLKNRSGHIDALKASIVSMLIMLLFLFVGDSILNIIGIRVNDFAIAGSLILFFIALEMILGIHFGKDDMPETASVVPIAFPLVAGTGTLTTLLSMRAQYALSSIITAVLLNVIVVFVVLKNLERIEKILGVTGIAVLKKVFGVVVLAIAIKLFRTNAMELLHSVNPS